MTEDLLAGSPWGRKERPGCGQLPDPGGDVFRIALIRPSQFADGGANVKIRNTRTGRHHWLSKKSFLRRYARLSA